MEGNAISAAFTALWRGLDGDTLSARVAVDLLNTEQKEVMRRARFAPALRALVSAREKDLFVQEVTNTIKRVRVNR